MINNKGDTSIPVTSGVAQAHIHQKIASLRSSDEAKNGLISVASLSFPIDGYTERSTYHTSEEYILEVISEGVGEHIFGTEKSRVRSGTVYLLTPTTLHRIFPESREKIISIHFGSESIPKSFLSIINSAPPLSCEYSLTELEALLDKCEQLSLETKMPNPFAEEMSKALLCELLITFFRKCSLTETNTPLAESPIASAMLSYIVHNFRRSFALRDISEELGISPNYLGEVFIEATGVPFSSYLKELRLLFAQQLLAATDISISDTSVVCGFTSSSYFIKSFRDVYGISPLQYRRTAPRRL